MLQNTRASSYTDWIERHAASAPYAHGSSLPSDNYRPKISLIVFVRDSMDAWLKDTVDSVRAQHYDNWELCIVDAGSSTPSHLKGPRQLARQDPRIQMVERPPCEDTLSFLHAALAQSTGEVVILTRQGDLLRPEALSEIVRELNSQTDLDVIYTDSDGLDSDGRRCAPQFRPDWSPDLLLSWNYIGNLVAYRRDIITLASDRSDVQEPCLDYDLLLRATELTDRIGHVPQPLCSMRLFGDSPETPSADVQLAGRKALAQALDRRGIAGEVLDGRAPGTYRVRYEIQNEPLVSIIIATRDKAELLKACVESVRQRTSYRNYEILVIDNASCEEATHSYLAEIDLDPRVRILRCPGSFNFSRINNLGVARASGEHVVLLNNDTEILEPGWIEAMLEHCQRPEVGAVGARLLYPSGHVQHAGVIGGLFGTAGHGHRMLPGDELGYQFRASVVQNFSAVTAACLMTRKSVYEAMGGFDEANLTQGFGDHDFCFRLRAAGLLIVWTPYAELLHHEAASRGTDDTVEERSRARAETDYFRSRWSAIIANDPYYNPNLTRLREDFSIRQENEREYLDDMQAKESIVTELKAVAEQRRELIEANHAAQLELIAQLQSKELAIHELHAATQELESIAAERLDLILEQRTALDDLRKQLLEKEVVLTDLKSVAEERRELIETNRTAQLDLIAQLQTKDVAIRDLHAAAQHLEAAAIQRLELIHKRRRFLDGLRDQVKDQVPARMRTIVRHIHAGMLHGAGWLRDALSSIRGKPCPKPSGSGTEPKQ